MNEQRRNIYLKKRSLQEARALLEERFGQLRLAAEAASSSEACGRVLAEPVYAAVSSPNFHAAAMDGLAVDAARTFGASESAPLRLAVGKEAFHVNTGHSLPEGCDAVIMIEEVNPIEAGPVGETDAIEIEAPVYPWQNVRKMGEDMVATELMFATNHQLTPYCIGALITAGVRTVSVWKKPRVLILPTGSELVDYETASPELLGKGKIPESNSYMLAALLEACGAAHERHAIVSDETGAILAAIDHINWEKFDILFILGGSSAGSEDYTRAVIEDRGEIFVHGVTMMPGKPVICGTIDKKPVFGLPGYPVSAIMAFEQLIQPLIHRMLKQPEPEKSSVEALPTRKLPSRLGVEEFIRVKLGKVGPRMVATPLPRGAGSITSITEADGIIRIPAEMEGVTADSPVSVRLLRPVSAVRQNLVCVGSHDNALDVIADMIRQKSSRAFLSSSHAGSMGGLMALKKGLCHLAGTHLLDTGDGSYNISYIKQYLPAANVHLFHLVDRDQGLIVPRRNPKGIEGIADLARSDISFVNRQAGSGTRILLDYHLEALGIKALDIEGYANEEYTHMAVAVSVLSGAADVGLGIYAAARALGLGFLPMVTESYDIVIADEFIDIEPVRMLLEMIASDEFRRRVERLGGYHTERSGELIWKSGQNDL
jgi:putative molybdopterin biosynthesis protein